MTFLDLPVPILGALTAIWLVVRLIRLKNQTRAAVRVSFESVAADPKGAPLWLETEARVWPSAGWRVGRSQDLLVWYFPLSGLSETTPPQEPRVFLLAHPESALPPDGERINVRGHFSDAGFGGRALSSQRAALQPLGVGALKPAADARAIVRSRRTPQSWFTLQAIISVLAGLLVVGLVALTIWLLPDWIREWMTGRT